MIFGVNTHGQNPQLAKDLGMDSVRITARMRKVYPTRASYGKGQPNWSSVSGPVSEARDFELHVLAVASTVPDWAGGGEHGTNLTEPMPWDDFVFGVEQRSDRTELWNEPDLEDIGTEGVGWDGGSVRHLQPWHRMFAGNILPVMSSRPSWRTALVYRGLRGVKCDLSFHANGEDRSLSHVFRSIRRHRAMAKVLAGYDTDERPWYVTECGLRNLHYLDSDGTRRWEKALTLWGTLEAAGCSGAWVYQLVDGGDGDGIWIHGAPEDPPDHAGYRIHGDHYSPYELVQRLRDRDWGKVYPDRLYPGLADYAYALGSYVWGRLRRLTGTD